MQIAAVNVAGQSPFSTLTVTRTAEAAPAGSPLSVVARNSSSTSILVTFDTPAAGLRNSIVTMFTVYFGKVPGQPNAAATPVPCSNPLVAGDLCPINVNRTLTPSVLNLFSLNIGVLEKYITELVRVRAPLPSSRTQTRMCPRVRCRT